MWPQGQGGEVGGGRKGTRLVWTGIAEAELLNGMDKEAGMFKLECVARETMNPVVLKTST